jgi:hypothetical protein
MEAVDAFMVKLVACNFRAMDLAPASHRGLPCNASRYVAKLYVGTVKFQDLKSAMALAEGFLITKPRFRFNPVHEALISLQQYFESESFLGSHYLISVLWEKTRSGSLSLNISLSSPPMSSMIMMIFIYVQGLGLAATSRRVLGRAKLRI